MSGSVLVPPDSLSGGIMPRILVFIAPGPTTLPLSMDLIILCAKAS